MRRDERHGKWPESVEFAQEQAARPGSGSAVPRREGPGQPAQATNDEDGMQNVAFAFDADIREEDMRTDDEANDLEVEVYPDAFCELV